MQTQLIPVETTFENVLPDDIVADADSSFFGRRVLQTQSRLMRASYSGAVWMHELRGYAPVELCLTGVAGIVAAPDYPITVLRFANV